MAAVKKIRLIQFLEGDNNQLSIARLLMFLSFWPSSFVVIITRDTAALTAYLTAYVSGYGVNKLAEYGKKKVEASHVDNADS